MIALKRRRMMPEEEVGRWVPEDLLTTIARAKEKVSQVVIERAAEIAALDAKRTEYNDILVEPSHLLQALKSLECREATPDLATLDVKNIDDYTFNADFNGSVLLIVCKVKNHVIRKTLALCHDLTREEFILHFPEAFVATVGMQLSDLPDSNEDIL